MILLDTEYTYVYPGEQTSLYDSGGHLQIWLLSEELLRKRLRCLPPELLRLNQGPRALGWVPKEEMAPHISNNNWYSEVLDNIFRKHE
jgi:hypothetical protein